MRQTDDDFIAQQAQTWLDNEMELLTNQDGVLALTEALLSESKVSELIMLLVGLAAFAEQGMANKQKEMQMCFDMMGTVALARTLIRLSPTEFKKRLKIDW